jgi:signal transduction histidine kinase
MSAAWRLSANNRAVIAGFVGLLLLMAFAEFEGLRTLRRVQTTNDEMREEFLRRTRLLDKIRADLYVSGTYVRDYLLEPDAAKAEDHRNKLVQARGEMDAALAKYRTILNAEAAAPFATLVRDIGEYWKVLDPVLGWNAPQRQQAGYFFLRDEVYPRRVAMLGIADQIGAIAESQLKAGKTRVEETYGEFRRLLAVTVALTIGLGIALALFSVREIIKLERETAARRGELQQLSARLVEAQEEERRSIARELHDEVGQSLTGVLVEMANLSTLIRNEDTEALAPKAGEIKKLVENSIGVVRNMALLLRPPMLDDLGLVPALQFQAREVSKRTGVRVKVAAEDVCEELSEELKTCVYRTVQEALHNCVQHAGARNVRVTIRQSDGRIFLTIQDDGKGFHAQQERGMGLLGIEERVAHLGGSFAVDSEPGHGALLRIVLPHAGAAA